MGTLALVFFAVVPSGRLLAPKEFPHPQLESRPHADLQRFLAQQQSQLQVYRWANADHSIVAIPIASAMEIIAQRGTKGYEPIASLPSYNPSPTGGQQ
jgi:hypothetical protein